MTRPVSLSTALLDPAFSFEKIKLVEASAGTGKTYSIQSIVLRLVLERGLTSGSICVVTFTDAATRELAHRIRSILRDARRHLDGRLDAASPDRDRIEAFLAILEEKEPARWRALARERLDRALEGFDDAAIFTIHGFCNRILSEWAFECGELFDRELGTDTDGLVAELVQDHYRRHVAFGDPLASTLAERAGLGLASLHALAGTMARRHEAAVVPDVRSDMTAEVLRERFEELRTSMASSALEAEWHETAAQGYLLAPLHKTLQRHLDALKGGANEDEKGMVRVLDAIAHFARENVERGISKKGRKNWEPSAALDDFVDRCGAFHRDLRIWGLAGLADFSRSFPGAFARLKDERRILTYEDMLTRVRDALNRPEAGELLLERLRRRYRVGIVDEFQDTDAVQWKVFRKIFAEGGLPLFLVGDPKQAIYSFRSGDIYTYLDAARVAHERYTLEKNFRSEGDLVAAVNEFFAARGPTSTFLVDEIAFLEQAAADMAPEKKLTVDGEIDPRPLRLHFVDHDEKRPVTKGNAMPLVAAHVAHEVARMLSDPTLRLAGRPLRPSDLCILTTKHKQGRLVQDELRRRNIPVVIQSSGNVFYGESFEFGGTKRRLHAQTRALVLLMRALAEPRNDRAIRAALASSLFPHRADEIHAMFVDDLAWVDRDHVLELFAMAHESCLRRSFVTAFDLLDQAFDLRAHLLRRPDGERVVTNLLQQVELVDRRMRDHRIGLGAAIAWLEGLESRGSGDEGDEQEMRLETDARAVQIMTVYKSKGLEFPVVFVPFMWDRDVKTGRNPNLVYHLVEDGENRLVVDLDGAGVLSPDDLDARRHRQADEELAENVRLLYVALTRAAHQVHLYGGRITNAELTAPVTVLASERLHEAPSSDGSVFARLKAASPTGFDAVRRFVETGAHMRAALLTPPDELLHYEDDGKAPPPEALRWRIWPEGRVIDRGWRIRSFTGLSRHRFDGPGGSAVPPLLEEGVDLDHGDAARDAETRPAPEAASAEGALETLIAFPAGARTGTAWHRVFEIVDFAADEATIRKAVEECLDRGRLVPDRRIAPKRRDEGIDAVAAMVGRVLATPLAAEGSAPVLARIAPEDRLAEMPFDFALRPGATMADLDRVLRRSWPAWEELGRNYRDDPESIGSGLMTGFIDLVFRRSGPEGSRYAILDWKSNRIGPTGAHFSPAHVRDEVTRSGYALQYLLYTLALDGHLRRCLAGYDYERHFEGVYYVFLRGVDGRPGRGVHADRPPAAAIAAARDLLMGGARD